MEHALPVELRNPSPSSPRDLLRLEQQAWGEDVGLVTKKQTAMYIMATLFPDLYNFDGLDCGFNSDGCIECIIHAYPAYASLPYILAASHGQITGKRRNDIDEEELVVFRGADEAVLKYPGEAIVSKEWQGKVFDRQGLELIVKPTIKVDGDKIALSLAASGVVKIEYQVVRYSHTLTVPPRAGEQNLFTSAVYGRFEGGITWQKIDPPPYADASAKEGYQCGWRPGGYEGGTSTTVNGPGKNDDPPTAPHHDPIIQKDYCSQLVIE